MKKYTALDLFFETGLRHLYQAEKAIFENLTELGEIATATQLKNLFFKHKDETQKQIERLEKIFSILSIDIHASKIHGISNLEDKVKELLKTLADINFRDRSKGIDGILKEGKELLRHFANTDAHEFALVSAGQKVEHFEIACYSSLSLIGEKYDQPEIIDLLKQSLSEELGMEKNISKFAQSQLVMLIHK